METKLIKNSGPEVGSIIRFSEFENYNSEIIDLKTKNTPSALFFLSITCNTCLKLMPQINDVKKENTGYLFYVFTDGEIEDNAEMSEYYNWDFPVFKLSSNEMLQNFNITYNPFVVIIDSLGIVESKGVVYETEDFSKIIRRSKE